MMGLPRALAQSGVVPGGSQLLDYRRCVQRDPAPIINDTVQWFQVQQYIHIHSFTSSSVEW